MRSDWKGSAQGSHSRQMPLAAIGGYSAAIGGYWRLWRLLAAMAAIGGYWRLLAAIGGYWQLWQPRVSRGCKTQLRDFFDDGYLAAIWRLLAAIWRLLAAIGGYLAAMAAIGGYWRPWRLLAAMAAIGGYWRLLAAMRTLPGVGPAGGTFSNGNVDFQCFHEGSVAASGCN